MKEVVSIYDAKTNLSKLVKKAQAGQVVYIGAYGQPQVMLMAVAKHPPLTLGVWKGKYKIDYAALKASDDEISDWLNGGE